MREPTPQESCDFPGGQLTEAAYPSLLPSGNINSEYWWDLSRLGLWKWWDENGQVAVLRYVLYRRVQVYGDGMRRHQEQAPTRYLHSKAVLRSHLSFCFPLKYEPILPKLVGPTYSGPRCLQAKGLNNLFKDLKRHRVKRHGIWCFVRMTARRCWKFGSDLQSPSPILHKPCENLSQ